MFFILYDVGGYNEIMSGHLRGGVSYRIDISLSVCSLSQILQIPLDTLRGQLAVTAAELGEVDTAIRKAK